MSLRWHLNVFMVKLAVGLLRLSGWYEGYWNHWRTLFPYAERKGLHIMPAHYYSPVPDTGLLSDQLWERRRIPAGFDLRIESARDRLAALGRTFGSDCGAFPKEPGSNPHVYHSGNSAYCQGDAAILYSVVRDVQPRKIIEIGSGYSTLAICQAIRAIRNERPDYQCDFTCIEPYPPAYLSPPPAEVTRFDSRPVQEVDARQFAELGRNDILFIDSTHVARIGSDVIYEYLTLLPSLSPGVLVHIHDIFIPAEYPREWIHEARFFWNEQYLLEAFLTGNDRFRVLIPSHAVWLEHGEDFRKWFPGCEANQQPPSSFWMERC